jgi:hypothetical protein
VIRPARFCALALLASAAISAPASAQNEAAPADPAAVVETFLRTFGGNHVERIGPLLTDRVATGDGESLRRNQIVLLHQGYRQLMFGPLRSFLCEAPVANAVTCMLRFQSRSLRQRYTVETGLIAGIETLPFSDEAAAK